MNGGVNIELLDNKLTATFDIYRRDTKGMLTQGKELPQRAGSDRAERERGRHEDDRMGTDRRLQDQFQLEGKPFDWGVKFMLSDNRSYITKFDNENELLINITKDGYRRNLGFAEATASSRTQKRSKIWTKPK